MTPSRFELQIGPIDDPILHTPCAVNMGNPHAVFFVDDPYAFNLEQIGPLLENHPIFPDRANIELAAVKAPDHIVLRVWERGAGITRACGSGACAALVAAVRRELSARKAVVSLPGGDLTIEWRESDGHVLMTGAGGIRMGGHASRRSCSRARPDGAGSRHLRLPPQHRRKRGDPAAGGGRGPA